MGLKKADAREVTQLRVQRSDKQTCRSTNYSFGGEVNMSHVIDGIVAFGIIAVFVFCGLRNRIYW
jgi:hypothetical protein